MAGKRPRYAVKTASVSGTPAHRLLLVTDHRTKQRHLVDNGNEVSILLLTQVDRQLMKVRVHYKPTTGVTLRFVNAILPLLTLNFGAL